MSISNYKKIMLHKFRVVVLAQTAGC